MTRCRPNWNTSPTRATAHLGIGRQRPLLDRLGLLAEDDVNDLRHGEAQSHRRIRQNQLLHFDAQLAEVPLPLLAEPVDCQPQQALLITRQVIDADAGQIRQAQHGRLEANLAVENELALADQNGDAKADEGLDCAGDLLHMRRVAFAQLARRPAQFSQRDPDQLEAE